MDHELLDKVKQLRMINRKLRRHEAVYLFRSVQLGMRLEEDNDVSMRKAPFLELNGVKKACTVTKNAILDISNKGV
jgi:hypothetical protein